MIRGKWSQKCVPHKGWECVDEVDVRDKKETCQMCESQMVRYVQVMQHPEYFDHLRCGCVCAGKMSQDLVGAELRDKEMKRKARKRKPKKPQVPEWRTSSNGNSMTNWRGYRVVIFPKHFSGNYTILIAANDEDDPDYINGNSSIEAAKMEAIRIVCNLPNKAA